MRIVGRDQLAGRVLLPCTAPPPLTKKFFFMLDKVNQARFVVVKCLAWFFQEHIL